MAPLVVVNQPFILLPDGAVPLVAAQVTVADPTARIVAMDNVAACVLPSNVRLQLVVVVASAVPSFRKVSVQVAWLLEQLTVDTLTIGTEATLQPKHELTKARPYTVAPTIAKAPTPSNSHHLFRMKFTPHSMLANAIRKSIRLKPREVLPLGSSGILAC